MSDEGRIGGWAALAARLPEMEKRSTGVAGRSLVALFGHWITIQGLSRLLAAPRPAIFALNHNNALESVLVPAALMVHRGGRNIRFAVDWMFLRLPLVGWVLRRVDPVPVYTKPFRYRLFERYRQARRHLSPVDGLAAALAEGDDVGIFPEGTRNPDPDRLARGRSGLGHLVLASGAPVQPVGIDYPARRRLGRAPVFGRAFVRVGNPLDFAAERAAVAAGERSAREAARRVVERTMRELAALSGKGISSGAAAGDEPTAETVPGTLEAT